MSLCHNCGKSGLLRCGGCPIHRFYCGRECQKAEWAQHKAIHKMRAVETMQDVEFNLGVLNGKAGELDPDCESLLLPGDKRVAEMIFFGLHPMKLKHQRVALGKSVIHGRGLFATETIEPQTILSFYPVHILSVDDRIEHTGQDLDQNLLELYERDYKFTRPGNACSIIGNPEQVAQPCLSHMVNDGGLNIFSRLDPELLRDREYCKHLLQAYYSKVKKRANCCHLWNKTNSVACLQALKPINKGEELLVTYGAVYWAQYEYGNDYADKFPYLFRNINQLDSMVARDIFFQ